MKSDFWKRNEQHARKEVDRRRARIIGEFRNQHGELFVVFRKYTDNWFVTGDEFDWLLDYVISGLVFKRNLLFPFVRGSDKKNIHLEPDEVNGIVRIILDELHKGNWTPSGYKIDYMEIMRAADGTQT